MAVLTTAPPATSTATCCVVIVHYRCRDDLVNCVASLREHAPGTPILIVENHSADGSLPLLEARYRESNDVEVLASPVNRGFGAGCNLGIERALARHPQLEHVLLLNPDTVVTEGFLDRLRGTAKRHNAGLVGGRIVDLESGATWFENGRLRPWTLTRSHAAAPRGETEFATEFVTGALMLVDAAMLRDGLRFDETYFLYAEDLDLCCEIRARGRSLWITTEAVVRHRGAGSQTEDPVVLAGLRAGQLQQMTRSKVLFARKRLGWLQRLVYLATAVLVRPLLGLVLTRGRTAFLRPYFRGLGAGLAATPSEEAPL